MAGTRPVPSRPVPSRPVPCLTPRLTARPPKRYRCAASVTQRSYRLSFTEIWANTVGFLYVSSSVMPIEVVTFNGLDFQILL